MDTNGSRLLKPVRTIEQERFINHRFSKVFVGITQLNGAELDSFMAGLLPPHLRIQARMIMKSRSINT